MFRDLLTNEPPVAVLYALLAEGIALVAVGLGLTLGIEEVRSNPRL